MPFSFHKSNQSLFLIIFKNVDQAFPGCYRLTEISMSESHEHLIYYNTELLIKKYPNSADLIC